VIRSIRDDDTETIFRGFRTRRLPPEIQQSAFNKLRLLDAATDLNALRVPPGNRLEALSGSREGQWSIRINDQWRICFVWRDEHSYDVEIVDYHR
jgi:toxin HigB-1